MATKAGTTTKAPARATVASLSKTVSELQRAVEKLSARVAALESALPGAVAAVAPMAAAAAPARRSAPAIDPSATQQDPMAGVHEVLRKLLGVGLEPDADDDEAADEQFFRFLELIHTERKGTPMLESSLRQYAFRQLRKNAPIYLRDTNDTGTYDVTRSEPSEVTSKTERVKVFLRAATRMPTPIALRRDAVHQGAWRIETTSL